MVVKAKKKPSASGRSRRTFTVEEVAELCIQDPDNTASDIDSSTGGISTDDEEELDWELLAASIHDRLDR